MSRQRPRELLTDPKRSHAFEFVVAGAVLLSVVLMFTLDLGMDLQEGFERFGRKDGDVAGPQARDWGVAEADFGEALDLPPTGLLAQRRTPAPGATTVTLQLRTGAPSAYVKLVVPATGVLEASAFLREGASLDVALAPGEYELRYALGETWYGSADLFGAATHFAAARERLDLRNLAAPGAAAEDLVVEFPKRVDGKDDERPLTRRDF